MFRTDNNRHNQQMKIACVQDLTIDHCIKESQPQLFEGFGKTLNKLRIFSARGCKELDQASLDHFLLECTSLQSLSFAHNRRFGHTGLRHLPCLRHLISCDLTGCQLGEDAMSALSDCSRLTELDLACCSQLSGAALRNLLQGKVGSSLQKLSLANNRNVVDDEILVTISTHCSALSKLDIAWSSVQDDGLLALSACDSLRSLSLSYCSGITAKGVLDFVSMMTRLEQLWIDGIEGPSASLSLETLEQVNRSCPTIKKLACLPEGEVRMNIKVLACTRE